MIMGFATDKAMNKAKCGVIIPVLGTGFPFNRYKHSLFTKGANFSK
jgi:hypothetical protein